MFGRTRKFIQGNAVACLALFVALGGSSYAAINLPTGSVGAKEIGKAAVRSAEVKNRSLKKVDLNPKAFAALKGAQGDKGEPGTPGISGVVRIEDDVVTGSGNHNGQAFCPDGKQAIGGGYSTAGIDDGNLSISTATVTEDGKSFLVHGRRAEGQGDWNLTAHVLCATVAQ